MYGNISRSVGDIHNLVPFKPTFTISYREARQGNIEDNTWYCYLNPGGITIAVWVR
jgi:hypothetical protein